MPATIRIFCKAAGSGTPVVFLHGGFGSSAEWDRTDSAEGLELLRSFIAGLEAGDPAHARRKAAYEASAAAVAARAGHPGVPRGGGEGIHPLTPPHRPDSVPRPPRGAAALDGRTDDTAMICSCSMTATMTTMARLSPRGGVLAILW
jgi:pimeloyl-ACP methyl ester carboxylesterase